MGCPFFLFLLCLFLSVSFLLSLPYCLFLTVSFLLSLSYCLFLTVSFLLSLSYCLFFLSLRLFFVSSFCLFFVSSVSSLSILSGICCILQSVCQSTVCLSALIVSI